MSEENSNVLGISITKLTLPLEPVEVEIVEPVSAEFPRTGRVTNVICFLCRSQMHAFDIECDPETCWHEDPEELPTPHFYTLTRCVECDSRLEMALKARDLIKENEEETARFMTEREEQELEALIPTEVEGPFKDQGDGFYA